MQQFPNDDSSQLSENWQAQQPPNVSRPFSPPVYGEQPQASYPQPGPYQPYQPPIQQPVQPLPFGQPPVQQPGQPMYQQQPQPFSPGYAQQPIPQQQPQPFPPGYPQQPMPQQPFSPGYAQQPSMYPQQPQSFSSGYPQQQSMYPQQPMPMMQQNVFVQPAAPNVVQVNINQKQHGFFVRAVYFVFIGSWFGFFWLNLGYLLCFTIVLFPVGLMMLNRLPQVLTLRPSGQQVNVTVVGGVTTINVGGARQQSFLIRALYFVFIGSWLGYLWACVGYGLCLTLLGMPIGLIMLNRLPQVLTLRRN